MSPAKTFLRKILIASALFLAPLSDATAKAPVCRGTDMIGELKRADPATYQRILAAAKETKNAGRLFWQIDKAGLAPSFLFGTMHLTDERVTSPGPAVTRALAASKRLIVEIADMSQAAASKAMAANMHLMLFAGGTKGLDAMLKPEDFAVVRNAVGAMGMPASFAARLKPWFANMTMALSGCERARQAAGIKALDQKLVADAQGQGLEILGVETIAEQFAAMASIPLADQLEMLKSTIRYSKRTQDLLETMVGLYRRRQIGAAWPLQLALAKKAGADISRFESFRQLLVVRRNHRMAARAIPHLKKGGTFFAVGALHLPGEEGLVALLRKAGFTVTLAE